MAYKVGTVAGLYSEMPTVAKQYDDMISELQKSGKATPEILKLVSQLKRASDLSGISQKEMLRRINAWYKNQSHWNDSLIDVVFNIRGVDYEDIMAQLMQLAAQAQSQEQSQQEEQSSNQVQSTIATQDQTEEQPKVQPQEQSQSTAVADDSASSNVGEVTPPEADQLKKQSQQVGNESRPPTTVNPPASNGFDGYQWVAASEGAKLGLIHEAILKIDDDPHNRAENTNIVHFALNKANLSEVRNKVDEAYSDQSKRSVSIDAVVRQVLKDEMKK
jgi:hypothetical protein